MDPSPRVSVSASDGRAQDSPRSTQVLTEVNTYEDMVENSASAHVTPVTYSQPEVLIRTFQGQLDAMMIEHERMRQQLSAYSPTLYRLGKLSSSGLLLSFAESKKSWTLNLLLLNHTTDCEFRSALGQP